LDKSAVGLGNVVNLDTSNPANIVWNANYRSVTDVEKSYWNGKANYIYDKTKQNTGFITDPVVTYNSTTKKITLSGSVEAMWQGNIVSALVNGWESDAIPGTPTQPYFLYYNGSTFVWSTSPWTFDMLMIAMVYYRPTGTYLFTLREPHGVMDWFAHYNEHFNLGTFKISGGTVNGIVLNSTTASERRPDTSITVVRDEDLSTTLSGKTDKLYTRAYIQSDTTITSVWNQADIVSENAGQPYWNQVVSGVGSQVPMSNNSYMCVWQVAMPVANDSESQRYKFFWVQGQSNGTLTSQQAAKSSDLYMANFQNISPEYLFITKIIIRYTGSSWSIYSSEDLSGSRTSQTSAPSANYLSVVNATAPLAGTGTASDPLYITANTYEPYNTNIQTHISSTSNPHSVTKSQVGLGNVPNTDTTNPANITWTSSYRTVTDTEKSTWNGKEDSISKSAGYLTWTGSAWSFKNETYSLSGHTHDDRYYTESEITSILSGYSTTSHNHSGVYEPVISKATGYLTWTGSAW
jgi:hypothetical protein